MIYCGRIDYRSFNNVIHYQNDFDWAGKDSQLERSNSWKMKRRGSGKQS